MSRLVPIIAILIAIGLFFGYINPTFKGSIAANQAQIQSFDSALSAAKRFRDKEAELSIARNAIPPDQLKRLEAFLPDGVDNVQLILDLDALAARSGMRLSNFDTSDPGDEVTSVEGGFTVAAENPVDSIDLTMNATGSYAALRTFLAGIEQSLRPLDVVAIQVVPSPTGVYSYDLTLRLYWLR